MSVSMNNLELSAEQHRRAREQVSEAAYLLWEAAGRPPGDGAEFWLTAEKEWIGHSYVPYRPLEMDIDEQAPRLLTTSPR
jgi:hypothetical protein